MLWVCFSGEVGREGIEPSWVLSRGILSPLRLPFRHRPRQIQVLCVHDINMSQLFRQSFLTSIFIFSAGLRPENKKSCEGHPRTSGRGPMPSALPVMSRWLYSKNQGACYAFSPIAVRGIIRPWKSSCNISRIIWL